MCIHLVHPTGIRTVPVLPLLNRFEYFDRWTWLPRSKLPIPVGENASLSNTWFLGPIQVHIPNGITTGSALFPGLTIVTDRQTSHANKEAKSHVSVIMTDLRSRCGHYIFVLWFLLLSFFHRLFLAVAYWMSTTHGVALVRI